MSSASFLGHSLVVVGAVEVVRKNTPLSNSLAIFCVKEKVVAAFTKNEESPVVCLTQCPLSPIDE